MKSFGATIQILRRSHGWSASQLALQMGFDKSYVSLVENGNRDPSSIFIERAAKALGVPVDYLLCVRDGLERTGCEITDIMCEFERLERKLRRLLKRIAQRNKKRCEVPE